MSKQKKKGFTLIELLAVIVVLAIILVIAVPKILEVIENAKLKAYEDSVNLMIKQAHLDYGSKNVTGSKIEYPVSYEYGIDSDGETIQTNEKEVGLLNFKGDKPSEGTIVVDELGKVTVQNLVSKDRKFCAIKGAGEKNATVGRATELNCIEEPEKKVVDVKPCELEIDKNDENIMYIDSVEDMYAFSDSVNSGNTYSGKTIKIRNDLDFKGYSEKKNVCGLSSTFEPIGNSSHPFSGKVDGNIKYIKNLTIDKTGNDNVGIFGYVTDTASFVGINLENITVKGKDYVGGLIGYATESTTKVNEVVGKNLNISGSSYIGGIIGLNGTVSNVIIKSGNVSGHDYIRGVIGHSGNVTNAIVENIGITYSASNPDTGPIGYNYNSSYYSNKVTLNGNAKTDGLSENATSNINMYEYAGLDTWIGGDNNSTGYYFDYENDNSNNIVLKSVKKNPITFNLVGEGTKENPYLIRNMKEWKMVAGMPKKQNKNNENAYYKIANDIDLSSGQFYMIGSANDNYFTGKVDGNLSKLYNLNMDIAPADNVGIFGYVTDTASFVGLNLENITVKGKDYVGGLIGYATESATKVNEVVAKNVNVSGTNRYVGGIIGYLGTASNVIIKSGTISGDYYASPIIGYNGVVSNSIVENATVTGTYADPISYSYNSSYYSNKVTLNGEVQTDGLSENAISNINMYEYAGLDTWIGGDNNSTGYYFDYESDTSNNIVLKSVKKNPITFNLVGEGTTANPYLIRNMKEWKMVAGRPNRNVYYKIANDIDLSSGQFYMIGSAGNPFSGKIDGNLSKLYNLNMDIAPADNVGIFGYVGETASFVGINLENVTVKGKRNVGGLIGYTPGEATKVNEVVAKNVNVSGTNRYVGGIIGYLGTASNVIIKSGTISGDYYASPIIGYNGVVSNSIVENATVTGTYADPISYSYNSSYYSNKVTVNGNAQTSGFDSEYIDDLDYYTNKVETRLNGDKNNTGYYFDYVYSKGGIYLVNKYDKQESDDDTPSSQKNCKVTYGAEVKGCYRYTGGTHDGYKYRSPSSGELDNGNGAACTGTGLSAAFRKKVYYSCN